MSDLTTALFPVDWFIPPEGDDYMGAYRACDICFESASEDAASGTFRQFWQDLGDGTGGIVVCEHCIDEYLREKPE